MEREHAGCCRVSPRAWARRQAHKLLVVRTAILVSTMFADCSSTDARPSGHATPGRQSWAASIGQAIVHCCQLPMREPPRPRSVRPRLPQRTSSSAVAAPAETAASARRSGRPHVGTTWTVSLTEVEQQRCPRRLGVCKDPDPAPSASARGMTRSAPAVREAAADDWTPRRAVRPRAIVRSAATGPALATPGEVPADCCFRGERSSEPRGGRPAGMRERVMRSRVILYSSSPALACIIGARRAWTVEMISSEEMPCR